MRVFEAAELPRRRAPAENFTGTVWVDPVLEAPEPARVRTAMVTFEPGGRTAWHSHPLGQTLYVLSGRGFVQWKDGPTHVIRKGDAVWISPGELHAHGAAPDETLCHMAIQENLDGKTVTWMEHVTDEEYMRSFA